MSEDIIRTLEEQLQQVLGELQRVKNELETVKQELADLKEFTIIAVQSPKSNIWDRERLEGMLGVFRRASSFEDRRNRKTLEESLGDIHGHIISFKGRRTLEGMLGGVLRRRASPIKPPPIVGIGNSKTKLKKPNSNQRSSDAPQQTPDKTDSDQE